MKAHNRSQNTFNTDNRKFQIQTTHQKKKHHPGRHVNKPAGV